MVSSLCEKVASLYYSFWPDIASFDNVGSKPLLAALSQKRYGKKEVDGMALGTEIFEQIFFLTRDFERNFRDQGRTHVSTTQFQALSILWDEQPVTAMEMANRLQVAGPTATRTVDSLERRNLVLKDRDPQDRRIVWLRLTDQGAAVLRAEQQRQKAWTARLIQNLSIEEQEALLMLMKKLTAKASD